MQHPLDRYAPFTDLHALKEASRRPLRRSLRVNTLKATVGRFEEWADEKHWELAEVPWCPEGFFVNVGSLDTPLASQARGTRNDKPEAFGRDLLHQLGHTYIQEAASMLPVELLDPQPGETILDLCAAPGSKTTQIAAKMGDGASSPCRLCHPERNEPKASGDEGATGRHSAQHDTVKGVIVANDTQEKRLWVLKQSFHRCGVTNVIVTKKEGEWFGKHMTERFDRVLVDAPCSAQGVIRSTPSAIGISTPGKIEKLAGIQRRLLEAGIHAAKVGGRIVYSTCTLTPEENEIVVLSMLSKFPGQIEIVDPRISTTNGKWKMENGKLDKVIEDSQRVQEHLKSNSQFSILNFQSPQPMLRLWPQIYDTEGFFCAVLRKVAPTRAPAPALTVPFLERRLNDTEKREVSMQLEHQFGTSFLEENEVLFERGDMLLLANKDSANFPLPVRDYSIGLPFAKRISVAAIHGSTKLTTGESPLRIRHDLVTLRGRRATKNTKNLTEEELAALLQGKDISCDEELRGDIILRYRNLSIGLGRAGGGILRNRLDRSILHQLR